MKKFSVLILTFLTTIVSHSQSSDLSQLYYGRYQGTADSSINMVANILRFDDKVSGNINYYDNKSNSLSIVGNIESDRASIKEFGKKTEILDVSINQNTINGSWNYNSNWLPISLTESYPKGSIPFDVFYLHSDQELVENDEDSPSAEIELTLIYPYVNKNEDSIIKAVCKEIQKDFFGKEYDAELPDSMLINYENEYYTSYRKQNFERYEQGQSFNWQKVVNMSIINNSEYVLCTEILTYVYSGGAHGMTNISYENIDLRNGSNISLDDIFKIDVVNELSTLLTKQLYVDKSLPIDKKLTDLGYFVDTVSPNTNIIINNMGIGFLYNSYEIAPYSFGQTKIFLKYSDIIDILNEESIVFSLAKK